MQRPANTQLSAKSITSMFLFLISIMYFRKSLLQKVLCLGKVWKQWGKQGNPIAQKINFAMQKKKKFLDNSGFYVYFSRAKSSKLFSDRISQN